MGKKGRFSGELNWGHPTRAERAWSAERLSEEGSPDKTHREHFYKRVAVSSAGNLSKRGVVRRDAGA